MNMLYSLYDLENVFSLGHSVVSDVKFVTNTNISFVVITLWKFHVFQQLADKPYDNLASAGSVICKETVNGLVPMVFAFFRLKLF